MSTRFASVEAPAVMVEPPRAGRGDAPVRAWVSRIIPNGAFVDGDVSDAILVAVELRNGQKLEIGYGTGGLTGKELEEIARL